MASEPSKKVEFSPSEHPHRRFNPLTSEWVLVSPHRMKRPWKGKVEDVKAAVIPQHDPNNPLCPRVTRASGEVNPDYKSTFVFNNDFPALLLDGAEPTEKDDDDPIGADLFRMSNAQGHCEVMCFHPRSDLTLALMTAAEVLTVVQKWAELSKERGARYDWVQIFENRGDIMGCSNPHPHCQIWCSNFMPTLPAAKERSQLEFFQRHDGKILLLEYLQRELRSKERIVIENDHWVCLVPFWAMWPYETMLVPKRHVSRFYDLDMKEQKDLATIMQTLLVKYDNLFKVSFPYSMGWQGAPTGRFLEKDCSHWQLHAVYLPPLLRSASVKKFMVGYEMLAEPQRDLTPEKAAETLRSLPNEHFSRMT